jgi:hypothetical protein
MASNQPAEEVVSPVKTNGHQINGINGHGKDSSVEQKESHGPSSSSISANVGTISRKRNDAATSNNKDRFRYGNYNRYYGTRIKEKVGQ